MAYILKYVLFLVFCLNYSIALGHEFIMKKNDYGDLEWYYNQGESLVSKSNVYGHTVAACIYSNTYYKDGWDKLKIYTSKLFSDSEQAYAAGYLESIATWKMMNYHYQNTIYSYCKDEPLFCEKLSDFLNENLKFIVSEVEKRRSGNNYWHQVGLVLEQIKGLQDGMNQAKPNVSLNIDVMDPSYLFQIPGDLVDIEKILKKKILVHGLNRISSTAYVAIRRRKTIVNELYDFILGHNTWSSYKNMLRISKQYSFNFKKNPSSKDYAMGSIVKFTSYPGVISSLDNFYIIDSGLAVISTSNINYNHDLYKHVNPKNSVLGFMRNIVSNRLATTAVEWCQIYEKYNSGTFNNQFMIVDFKKFNVAKYNQDGNLFFVLEQMPNKIIYRSQTDHVNKHYYWSSYSIPYYPEIYKMSNRKEVADKFGEIYSYDKCPIAKMFKEKDKSVHNYFDAFLIMRFNDFENDYNAHCKDCSPPYSAMNALAGRGDLNKINGYYPFEEFKDTDRGAIDTKVVSFETFIEKFTFLAVNGPTYAQQPVFDWNMFSNKDNILHNGHPQIFDFPVIYL